MWIKKEIYNRYKQFKKDIEKAGNYDAVIHYDHAVIISEVEYASFLSCKNNEKKIKQQISLMKSDMEILKDQIDNQEEIIEELKAEVEKYKHLYVDEYQKRLELINIIKKEK